MSKYTEERVADLIAALPPAPAGWVDAAVELPLASAAIEGIVARCLAEEGARQAALADLEQTLRQAGVEPRRELVDRLRQRIA
ncbi:MAG TPA: hypothetical protein VG405_11020 [Solirubrobacteraceae bacterium]|jgi:hypothetical protein|nr:hypothetical protein [Solirubrobacteraceae bacterium]